MTMRNRLILLASAGVGGLFGLSVSKGETTVAVGFSILFILIGLMLTRFTRRLHQRFGIDSSKTSPWLLVGLVLGGVAGSYLALEWQLGEQVLEVLNPSLSPVHRGPPLSQLLGFLAGAGVGGTTLTTIQKLVRRAS